MGWYWNFKSLVPWKNTLLLFKIPGLWHSVLAALGKQCKIKNIDLVIKIPTTTTAATAATTNTTTLEWNHPA